MRKKRRLGTVQNDATSAKALSLDALSLEARKLKGLGTSEKKIQILLSVEEKVRTQCAICMCRMSSVPKTKRYMTVEQRHDLVAYLQSHPACPRSSVQAALPHLNLKASTISKYRKQDKQTQVMNEMQTTGSSSQKRQKISLFGQYPTIEETIVTWIKEKRNGNVPLTDEVILCKATDIKHAIIKACTNGNMPSFKQRNIDEELKMAESFKASVGWLDKVKTRHNLKQVTLQGENAEVSYTTAEKARQDMQKKLASWDEDNIYNLDETACFFKLLPNKTISAGDDEKGRGMKRSKARITVMICSNATGSHKLRVLVIGKSKTPRALKNVNMNNMPSQYTHSKKAWMTSELLDRWLRQLNSLMTAKNKHIIILMDNARCHTILDTYSHIEIAFLPPNLTSEIQPCDQGIIRSLKCHYKRRLVHHTVRAHDMNIKHQIDIYRAMHWLAEAWDSVTPTTIRNCWVHAGILPPSSNATLRSESEKDTSENDDMKKIMEEISTSLTKMNMDNNVNEFIDNDTNVATEDPVDEIDDPIMIVTRKIESMKETDVLEIKDDSEDEEEEEESELISTITKEEAVNMINSLCHYLVCDTSDNKKLLYHLRRKMNDMTFIKPKTTQQQTLDMFLQ